MIVNYETIKRRHPDYNIELYDNITALEFIKKNYDNRIVVAYQKLRPYNYKSHIFRYCYLYKKGGIYVDIKYKTILDFNFSEISKHEYFCYDKDLNIRTSVISVFPYNLLMREIIYKIALNSEMNYQGEDPLDITGTTLITRLYDEVYDNKPKDDTLIWAFSGDRQTIFLNGRIVLKELRGYKDELYKICDQDHYSLLYNDQDIYNWI